MASMAAPQMKHVAPWLGHGRHPGRHRDRAAPPRPAVANAPAADCCCGSAMFGARRIRSNCWIPTAPPTCCTDLSFAAWRPGRSAAGRWRGGSAWRSGWNRCGKCSKTRSSSLIATGGNRRRWLPRRHGRQFAGRHFVLRLGIFGRPAARLAVVAGGFRGHRNRADLLDSRQPDAERADARFPARQALKAWQMGLTVRLDRLAARENLVLSSTRAGKPGGQRGLVACEQNLGGFARFVTWQPLALRGGRSRLVSSGEGCAKLAIRAGQARKSGFPRWPSG